MPPLKKIFDPKSYPKYIRKKFWEFIFLFYPNLRGAVYYPPGHYYSPLLDIASIPNRESGMSFDGKECWENISLYPTEQCTYYEDLLKRFPFPHFPKQKSNDWRYYWQNDFFKLGDAFTLSGIIRREKPKRIIEVGSGFSSAVMLDTAKIAGLPISFTFIEPFPKRLNSLLLPNDTVSFQLLAQKVQEVPLSTFDVLEPQDILFIDSSHVAKIGSDVTFLFLRVLPRLKPGVFIHIHDIFYPNSYCAGWIHNGWAWNETLFLRAFLLCNTDFKIVAFNSFAGQVFPEIFRKSFPNFLNDTGGSIWLKRVSRTS